MLERYINLKIHSIFRLYDPEQDCYVPVTWAEMMLAEELVSVARYVDNLEKRIEMLENES